MSDTIIVEFSRNRLISKCKTMQHYPHNSCIPDCRKTDKDLINCAINGDFSCYQECGDFKIKEQNNKIKTKFNIGDKIFALKEFEGVDDKGNLIIRIDIKECVVHFINIGISKRGRCIKYTYDLFPEEDCFATKAEAQAEADRRNNG